MGVCVCGGRKVGNAQTANENTMPKTKPGMEKVGRGGRLEVEMKVVVGRWLLVGYNHMLGRKSKRRQKEGENWYGKGGAWVGGPGQACYERRQGGWREARTENAERRR